MKRKFLRTLVLVVAAFAALSVFVCADSLNEFEGGYIQGEMLKESSQSLTVPANRQTTGLAMAAVSGQRRYPPNSAAVKKSLALVCLSTCVLLC